MLHTCSKVLNQLYLGNAAASKDLQFLKGKGITHVLVCADECQVCFPEHFEYKVLPLEDTIDFQILNYFQESFEFLEASISEGGTVFVHCRMGASRSASIVVAFVMKKLGYSFKKAFKFVKKLHPDTHPNFGFQKQLSSYSKQLPKKQCCII